MSIELNKESVEQADASSCQGTNCGTTTGDHSSECLAEAAAGQGWELKPGDLCGRDCPIHKILAEQAGANVGHGHVFPRADGVKMRCGGPGLCSECTADASCARAALAQPSPAIATAPTYQFHSREIGESDWAPCDFSRYLYCSKSPEMDTRVVEVTAQPSPAQAEQAEAERLREENANLILTCASLDSEKREMQHKWDAIIAERDAALARVGQQERTIAGMNEAHAKLADLYEAAQAQHSGPEEFSFEYRHPNGESHTVTVSRDQVINEMPDFLFEALCSKFCNCEPVGETNVVECCCDEYAEEFKLLAAAPGKEGV